MATKSAFGGVGELEGGLAPELAPREVEPVTDPGHARGCDHRIVAVLAIEGGIPLVLDVFGRVAVRELDLPPLGLEGKGRICRRVLEEELLDPIRLARADVGCAGARRVGIRLASGDCEGKGERPPPSLVSCCESRRDSA